MTNPQRHEQRGYGNIYTPHAGSMIIQVQREGGLANRTIILGTSQVRLLRFFMSRVGKTVIGLLLMSWVFFGWQTTRVPVLTARVHHMELDALRLDTLQVTLAQLQRQYNQVQAMLGASGRGGVAGARSDSVVLTIPTLWPLRVPGYVTRGMTAPNDYSDAHPGLDIAAEVGTEVRAAGGGVVVEVKEDEEYGLAVRLAHPDGYETLYAHTSRVLVKEGDRVAAGSTIAMSGNSGRSTAPHLHFEVRRAGKMLDPMELISKETRNGNIR